MFLHVARLDSISCLRNQSKAVDLQKSAKAFFIICNARREVAEAIERLGH